MSRKSSSTPATEKLVGTSLRSALDSLEKQQTRFHELSDSRLGGFGDAELAGTIVEKLKARGLARNTEDGVSVPLHPMVHSLVLVLLAQILVPHGRHVGLVLEPATDRVGIQEALTEILSLPTVPSAGNVVATDLETVGVDLGPVPLDEVLSYRTQHRKEYRAYRRAIRKFIRDLSLLPAGERAAALSDRTEEIEGLARDIERTSQKAWKQSASFGLGIISVRRAPRRRERSQSWADHGRRGCRLYLEGYGLTETSPVESPCLPSRYLQVSGRASGQPVDGESRSWIREGTLERSWSVGPTS